MEAVQMWAVYDDFGVTGVPLRATEASAVNAAEDRYGTAWETLVRRGYTCRRVWLSSEKLVDMATVSATLREAASMLKELEYSNIVDDGPGSCPMCGNRSVHSTKCPLDAFLTKLRALLPDESGDGAEGGGE